MVKISEVLDSSEMTLLLSNNIMKRINSSSCEGKKLTGVLYGFEWKNEVIAVTFIITPGFEIFENDFQNIEAIFPSGIYPIGIFIIGGEAEDPDSIELPNHVMEHISKSLLRETSNDVNCVVVFGTDIHHDIASYAVNSNNDMKTIKHEFVNMENMWNDYMLHHITGIMKVSCPLRENEILKNLENLKEDVQSRSVAFFLENDSFFIRYTSSGDVECTTLDKEVTCDKTVQEIASYVPSNESTIINAKHKKNAMDFHHMNWRVNPVVTGSYVPDRILRCVPVINQAEEESPCLTLPIKLDCLAITHKTTTGKYLMKYLCQAVVRQLKCVSFVIKKLYAEGKKLSLILPYHFYPELCGHPLTLLYPQDLTESDLEPWRQNLHSMLCLPMDVPTVRRANEHTFDWHVDGYIKNPHIGVPSPKLNGEVALVRGDYTYHHYMQDKKDDKGWGCAYRSLQTLVSWFRFQGYTEKPIPSHKEIQECLVALGDKPTSFIGSTQWIGSTEVSYVLDSLFGITSKILFVNTGEDMGSQGRELLHHFRTQGTPVMIGGGVLAHTILGVDFNCSTGDISFLILDPHYTGEEDLATVQNKGFCGWKKMNFWDKKAHYNMCLPLRPSML